MLFDKNVLIIVGVAGACMVLRPIHTGPIARSAIIAFALSPWMPSETSWYIWLFDTVVRPIVSGWQFIGSFPTIFLRLPCYVVFVIVVLLAVLVAEQLLAWFVLYPAFALMELESVVRQTYRDRAAQLILDRLRLKTSRPSAGPRFSLYLRPFKTASRLASNAIAVMTPEGPQGNIQTDFEAILAASFPAHRPLIALGTPGELLSTHPEGYFGWPIDHTWDIPGTGKIAATEDDWRDKVLLLADHAEQIVIVPLDFAGTKWEIRTLHQLGLLHKCVFVMPATMYGAHDYSKEWEDVTGFLSSLGIKVPGYDPSGRLFVVNDDNQMTVFSAYVKSPLPRSIGLLIRLHTIRRRRERGQASELVAT